MFSDGNMTNIDFSDAVDDVQLGNHQLFKAGLQYKIRNPVHATNFVHNEQFKLFYNPPPPQKEK
jgi:hypothetical protein